MIAKEESKSAWCVLSTTLSTRSEDYFSSSYPNTVKFSLKRKANCARCVLATTLPTRYSRDYFSSSYPNTVKYFAGENQIQSSSRTLVNLPPFPDCLSVHLKTALNLLHPQKEAPYGWATYWSVCLGALKRATDHWPSRFLRYSLRDLTGSSNKSDVALNPV